MVHHGLHVVAQSDFDNSHSMFPTDYPPAATQKSLHGISLKGDPAQNLTIRIIGILSYISHLPVLNDSPHAIRREEMYFI